MKTDNKTQMYIMMMMTIQLMTVTETTSTQPEQSFTAFLLTHDVTIPTEKVGCIFVTPVKTENNKPYIDNIDAYNRDRVLITKSLSDRLGLGQNSLPGGQQIRVAVKHADQMMEIPEHLR